MARYDYKCTSCETVFEVETRAATSVLTSVGKQAANQILRGLFGTRR